MDNKGGHKADIFDRKRWVVAIVNHNSERMVADKLMSMGLDTFVATQTETKIRKNGQRAKVEKVIIPSMVFLRVSEEERRQVVNLPFVYRFLTDRAGGAGIAGKPIAVIPDQQMDNLRFMLGKSDTPVCFVDHVYGKNERVRVIRGKLLGLEGVVQSSSDGKSTLVIEVDFLGGASVTIDPRNLQPLD